jgi:two-component system response regulator DegU
MLGRVGFLNGGFLAGTLIILIAEQSEILRTGIRALLADAPDLVILRDVATPAELFARMGEESPNILLLGLNPPYEKTLEIIQEVRRRRPATHLILLADHISESGLLELIKAGVKGHLPTRSPAHALKKALRAVAEGEYWVGRNLIDTLCREVFKPCTSDESVSSATALLTKREAEIVGLLSQGRKNKAIADRLSISEKTVKTHLANIYPKLKIHSRLQAVLHCNGHPLQGNESSLA